MGGDHLDLTLQIHGYILGFIEDAPQPSPLLRMKVKKGETGFASGRGFKTRTPRDIEECRTKLRQHLMEWGSR